MTDQIPNRSLRQEITTIALNFPIFACFDCAETIRNFLIAQGISGRQILLSTGTIQDLGQNFQITETEF